MVARSIGAGQAVAEERSVAWCLTKAGEVPLHWPKQSAVATWTR